MVKKRVLLAFSGGTDSCYSAAKLAGEGYDVEGLILDMTGDSAFLESAQQRALELGLPVTVADVREKFERDVIGYFTAGYVNGRTPAPCTVCNPLIKWKTLYDVACAKGFDHIATGHYFRTVERGSELFVGKAADPVKDQSYYLWMLPRHILEMAITPMGDEIKKMVVEKGRTPVQKESMGVCFLAGKDYRDFVRDRCGDSLTCRSGEIKDAYGNTLGTHEGCAFYTTGQKKGLGLQAGMAVTAIDAGRNELIAGPRESLFVRRLVLRDHLVADHIMECGFIPDVKVRGYGVNPAGGGTITVVGDGRLEVILSEPAFAPAAGQPVVFYDGELVVGGGFIESYG